LKSPEDRAYLEELHYLVATNEAALVNLRVQLNEVADLSIEHGMLKGKHLAHKKAILKHQGQIEQLMASKAVLAESSSDEDSEEEEEDVQLHFRCKDLSSKDMLSKSDALIVLFIDDEKAGQTETLPNTNNPIFKTSITITHFMKRVQQARIEVRDDDGNDGKKFDIVGTTDITVTDMLAGNGLWIHDGKGNQTGKIFVANK
jgi:hypothetical protein